MDITEDLSYAQTFYKRRTVRVYLNELAQRVYTGVHKQKADSMKKLFTVWTKSLPLEIYRSRKNLLFALIMFLIYVAIGVFNTHMDPDFLAEVVGQRYLEMTLDNIQSGNPLAVYHTDDQLNMFIQITTNNLKVAFLTFFVGFFFTIGTHLLMFTNGVMLGSFQYFFHTKGLLITSFLGIWIHGAFEISAIVLAGGAGITAGNGLLFPGSYTRLQSLQLSTKRSLKIMMSLVPFIIMAGFLESFVTANYQDLPDWSKWTLILLSFALILFYYVFYPMYVARKYPELVHQEEVVNSKPKLQFLFNKIRSIGEIFADSTRYYRAEFGRIMRINLSITLPVIVALVAFQDYAHYNLQQQEYWWDWASQLEIIIGAGFYSVSDIIVLILWSAVFAMMFTSVFWAMRTKGELFSWQSFFIYTRKKFWGIWLANSFITLIVFVSPFALNFLLIFIYPFLFLIAATTGLSEEKFSKSFGKGFKYSATQYGKSIVLMLILVLITFIVMQPIAFVFSYLQPWTDEPMVPDLLDMLTDFIKRVAQIYTDDYIFPANVVRQLFYLTLVFLMIPLVAVITGFSFFSEQEKQEATGLRNASEKFGKRSRVKETDADFE